MSFLTYNFIDFKGFKLSLLSLIWLLGIYFLVHVLLRIFRVVLHRNFVKRNIIDKAREFTIYSLVRYVVFTLTVLVMLGTLGVKISWLFGAGIPLLVGIGLGLQTIFKDFVSGIVLSYEGSIRVGDVIQINNLMAQVRKIDLRSSKIETADGIFIIVPNSKLLEDNIINWSHNRKETRLVVFITLAYGTDVPVARHLMYQVLIANPHVSQAPKPIIRLDDFGDHGIRFKLLFWCKEPWDMEDIKSDVRYALEKALKERNIVIPFPQLDLRVVNKSEQ